MNDIGADAYDLEQTRDGGQSWSKVKIVLWQGQLDFVSEQAGWAIAHLGEAAPNASGAAVALLKTTDGGASWQEIKPIIGP